MPTSPPYSLRILVALRKQYMGQMGHAYFAHRQTVDTLPWHTSCISNIHAIQPTMHYLLRHLYTMQA